jgi:hypothetical protein
MRGLTKIAVHLERTRIVALEAEGAGIIDRMATLNDRALDSNRRLIASALKMVAARRRRASLPHIPPIRESAASRQIARARGFCDPLNIGPQLSGDIRP